MRKQSGGAHLPGHALDAEWCPVYINENKAQHRNRDRIQLAIVCLLAVLVIAAVVLTAKTAAGFKTMTTDTNADITPMPPVITMTKLDAVRPEQTTATAEQTIIPAEHEMPKTEQRTDPTEQTENNPPSPAFISESDLPLSEEYEGYMITYCEMYGCPYILALAVAEVESHFDMDAVGALGEVGIMQLNPGPAGSYHAEIKSETGLDPATPEGNIAGGCYKLGKYMQEYNDPNKAVMAYNMGATGAKNAWANGITSTEHSRAVVEAMARWDEVVSAWYGT